MKGNYRRGKCDVSTLMCRYSCVGKVSFSESLFLLAGVSIVISGESCSEWIFMDCLEQGWLPQRSPNSPRLNQVKAKVGTDPDTHTDLLQEPHEAGRRHHADLPHKGLRYRQAPLLLAAAFWVGLGRGKEARLKNAGWWSAV